MKYAGAKIAHERNELMVEAFGLQGLGWDGAAFSEQQLAAVRSWLRRVGAALDTLSRPLPAPPTALRRGPFRDGTFDSPLRSQRLTSLLGVALGTTFGICFVTGLISHFIQHPAA